MDTYIAIGVAILLFAVLVGLLMQPRRRAERSSMDAATLMPLVLELRALTHAVTQIAKARQPQQFVMGELMETASKQSAKRRTEEKPRRR